MEKIFIHNVTLIEFEFELGHQGIIKCGKIKLLQYCLQLAIKVIKKWYQIGSFLFIYFYF